VLVKNFNKEKKKNKIQKKKKKEENYASRDLKIKKQKVNVCFNSFKPISV
jgi:hypothetical protein